MIRLYFLIVLISFIGKGFSQGVGKTDSLLKKINATKVDSTKVNLLSELSALFQDSDPEKSIFYAREALNLSVKINFGKGIMSACENLATCFYFSGNYDSSLFYFNKSLSESFKMNNITASAHCYNNLGSIYDELGEYEKALENYFKSLKLYQKLNIKYDVGTNYSNIGLTYSNKGNYKDALKYYLLALKIFEQIDDKKSIAKTYSNLGNLYTDQKNYPTAYYYYKMALNTFEKIDYKRGITGTLNNIGIIFYEQNKFDQALDYYQKSLKLSEELGNKHISCRLYGNIGLIYKKKGNYKLALENLFKSLTIKEQLGEKKVISSANNNIGTIYIAMKDYQKAIEYCKKALDIANEINSPNEAKDALNNLADAEFKMGNFKMAYVYKDSAYTANDSLYSKETATRIAEMQTKYETEKKQKEIELLNKDKELQKTETRQQRLQKYAFIGGFVFMLLLSVVIFKSYRDKKKANQILKEQKHQIEEKNEELNQQNEEISAQRDEIEAQRDTVTVQKNHIEKIHVELTDSIRYAKRIQQAVLPVSDLSREIMGEHFILFEPRNVVSGDFYWFVKRGDFLIIAVADCTGHGVPGAFMSMLGVSFLNEIVSRSDVTTASGVLNEMRQYVISSLQQQGVSGEQKDGMDMSVVAINTRNLTMQFAGANNPIYIVRKLESEKLKVKTDKLSTFDFQLYELKPDKMPIAIHIKMDDFTNHEMQLQKGDLLYLFSDGYADQFGGPKGRKFMYAPFKEFLLQISNNTMNEQRELLSQNFEKWKNGYKAKYEQIDDVTVLGVKI